MSEDIKKSIFEGGNIEFVDVAALSIATALFISQGNEEVLEAIGELADSLKESFTRNDEKENEQ